MPAQGMYKNKTWVLHVLRTCCPNQWKPRYGSHTYRSAVAFLIFILPISRCHSRQAFCTRQAAPVLQHDGCCHQFPPPLNIDLFDVLTMASTFIFVMPFPTIVVPFTFIPPMSSTYKPSGANTSLIFTTIMPRHLYSSKTFLQKTCVSY